MAPAAPRGRGRRGSGRAGALGCRLLPRQRGLPPHSTTFHCACDQARVWSHVLLKSTAKFSTGQVQESSRVPTATGDKASLGLGLALCLPERSNIYIFVISYLKPTRRLDIQRNQQVF